MTLPSRLLLGAIVLALSLPRTGALAQEPVGPTERVRAAMERAVRETLNSPLFRTQEKGNLSVWIEPHPGDLIRRDYLRLPLRLEYGLTDHIEIRSAVHPFIDNPFRSRGDEGFTHLSLGFKNQWRRVGQPGFLIATGIDFEEPFDAARMDLHDHRAHFMPFITASHKLAGQRDIELFSSFRLDLSPDFSMPERVADEPPALHDHGRLTFGALYRTAENLAWTIETIWEHNFESAARRDNLYLAPGFIWDIPRRRTGLLPGRWQVGLGVRFGLLDARDELRLQTRVRWSKR